MITMYMYGTLVHGTRYFHKSSRPTNNQYRSRNQPSKISSSCKDEATDKPINIGKWVCPKMATEKRRCHLPTHWGEGGSMTIILDLSPSTRVSFSTRIFRQPVHAANNRSLWKQEDENQNFPEPLGDEIITLCLNFFWNWFKTWIS